MRFHLLGLSHTKTTRAYSCCAFTQKVRLLSKILTGLGHEVIHYGTEGSDPVCSEKVDVLSEKTFNRVHGGRDYKLDGFNIAQDNAAVGEFTINAIKEIKARQEPGDFLLCPFGVAHYPIANALENLIVVESGIGYEGTFAQWRVFESYAWMHFHYGREGRALNPSFYDTVIPNYLDMDDYPFMEHKQNYFVFVGRDTPLKGLGVASEVCEEIGAKLVVAGQGKLGDKIVADHVGVVSIEDRATLVGNAKALFAPTRYIEPFGTVVIEAAAYGTPVITTDFGAFTENVVHGRTGWRCRTFEEFVWAAKNVDMISPKVCRTWAMKNYSLKRVGAMYDEYFRSLSVLHQGEPGWYARNPGRERLDALRRAYR